LFTCCDSCGEGCDGGWPILAWNYMISEGLVTGDLYGNNNWCKPYPFKPCDHHVNGTYGPCPPIAPTPSCDKTCNPKYPIPYYNDIYYG